MIQHNAMGINPQMTAPAGGFYNFTGVPTQVQPKVMNALTEDEIKFLQQDRSQFSLGLTQKEQLQGACTHRLPDGSSDSLTYDPITGVARCTICGYEFRPVDADTSIEDVTEAKDKVIDMLQTIKLLYTDLPSDAAREYFQIIPLLMKLPQLFEFAAKNFAKHELNAWQYQQYQNMNGINLLTNLGNILGAGQVNYGAQPMYQQPVQPMMGGMAAGYPGAAYGQPVMPGANAFGYPGASQPMMQQPAVNPGYAYTPGQTTPVAPTVQTPATPAAPTAPAETVSVTEAVQP
ncbi:MAG: hypothetical protein IKR19_09065 [Acholeplasmatales bacterium]|nr:hypothetical protein [Acholeplasmatales bacterium]